MIERTGTCVTRVSTVAVPVTDQDRALEFYTGVLGFVVRRDGSFGDGQRWLEVGPADGETTVALMATPPGGRAGVDTGIRLATTDAAGDHAHLLAGGADVDSEIMRWPGVPPMFRLRDPDGNALVLVEIP